MCKPQNTCALPIFRHQELMKRTIHSALRVFILTIMGLNKQGKGFDWLATSFPGSCLFLPRGRKRQDPGNEVASQSNPLPCLFNPIIVSIKTRSALWIVLFISSWWRKMGKAHVFWGLHIFFTVFNHIKHSNKQQSST